MILVRKKQLCGAVVKRTALKKVLYMNKSIVVYCHIDPNIDQFKTLDAAIRFAKRKLTICCDAESVGYWCNQYFILKLMSCGVTHIEEVSEKVEGKSQA